MLSIPIDGGLDKDQLNIVVVVGAISCVWKQSRILSRRIGTMGEMDGRLS